MTWLHAIFGLAALAVMVGAAVFLWRTATKLEAAKKEREFQELRRAEREAARKNLEAAKEEVAVAKEEAGTATNDELVERALRWSGRS